MVMTVLHIASPYAVSTPTPKPGPQILPASQAENKDATNQDKAGQIHQASKNDSNEEASHSETDVTSFYVKPILPDESASLLQNSGGSLAEVEAAYIESKQFD
jgi:hypothetical protein